MNKTKLQKAIDSTKRTQYINKKVLETAPSKIGGTLEFFPLGKYVSTAELEKEYESRGLIPADIETICEYDLENKEKMDKMKYVGTHWKDKDGKFCYAVFRLRGDERSVYVLQRDRDWRVDWWFAGVRKSSEIKSSALSDPLPLELIINGITYIKKE